MIVAPTAGFNSYASVADADAYFASFANATWAALTTPQKEAALIRGSQYITGKRIIPDYVTPVVFPNIVYATCEAAIRASAGTLYRDVPANEVISQTVGPISTTYKTSGERGQPCFKVIEDLLVGMTYLYVPARFERA